ncbi:MAG: nitrate ABC transporter permease [Candidatus Brennerbacteria bacterium CG11_big_fil_rev_8_21_14_0_20_43_10]|uniref:Nitrate ABC transporter permease n=2 Tax=Candidatus Brenneribacteriota TaxID=1817902 RepID=A0A2M8C1V9_9BACT|nr:MAG: nitrate ABC transporter permease [Candidatus Brennerbacteria bacterium CG23_combo_of_CG06-09_8_20_14_all_44_41]PIR25769.1 MAG: nitrate ABC transporter permease [Candidatus Brennerbacteria bacterium CG11_big_fil_rev_8_21_14_0_20_43_10]PJB50106.1 MAG: nitrate ABC transporter permease [Candidatus Brennerbacteria bacterium CG_4_9_14_3_um_filter_43_9]
MKNNQQQFKFPQVRTYSWVIPVIILFGLIALWEIWVYFGNIPKWQLPAPSAIAQELVASWELLSHHAYITLQEIIIGFFVALVSGVFLAGALVSSKILERAILPILISSQTIPIIAIAPLLLIWVGYGLASKVIIVALISFYPIAVNTIDGLKAINTDMIVMMKSLGASRWQIFSKLQVPTSLPYMFSGIKVGISLSVIGAVIGEWVGSSGGLGYLIKFSQPLFLTSRVFAAIFVLSVMGVVLFALAGWVEHLMLPWYYQEKRAKSINQ